MSAAEIQSLIAVAAENRVAVSIDPSGAVTLTPMDAAPSRKRSSAERVRRYRERKSEAQNVTDVTQCNALQSVTSVTCNASPPPLPLSPQTPLSPAPPPAASAPAHTREAEGFTLEAGEGKQPKRFVAPTEQQWISYAATLSPPFPATAASKAWNHYVANGWKVGRAPMKDWKAACRLCHGNHTERPGNEPPKPPTPTKKHPWEQ